MADLLMRVIFSVGGGVIVAMLIELGKVAYGNAHTDGQSDGGLLEDVSEPSGDFGGAVSYASQNHEAARRAAAEARRAAMKRKERE